MKSATVQIVFYLALAVVVGWFVYQQFSSVAGLRELDNASFAEELKNKQHILIDVRESSEVASGYIPGAVHIPLGQLKDRLQEVPRDRSVMLYCRSGNRSRQAANILLKEGYSDVTHLKGGILGWMGQLKK